MPRLYLIDGTALAYRSFFAFASSPRGGLSTKEGRPTGAVYGFVQTLRALLDREHPDHVVVSFDGAREGLARTKLYAEYKSTRAKMPDELVPQLGLIEQVVDAFGIPVVKSDVHEADDVIGTLAVQARAAGMEVFIVTGDKDFMQIVDDKVKLWNLRTSTRAPEIIGTKEVKAKFGVEPRQIVDLLALMGDSSDNVPGVPKVGEKTATELLHQFGSLEAILTHTDEVKKPAIRASLEAHVDDARLSQKLVTLHTDVELPCRVTELPAIRPKRAELEAIFRELEFDSLLASLPVDATAAEAIAVDYRVVQTEAELHDLVAELRRLDGVAIAAEASAPEPRRAELLGLAFALAPGVARFVPCAAQATLQSLSRSAVLAALRPLLEDADVPKFCADAKHDMAVLRRAGITLRGVRGDTMLASYCLTPGQGSHQLEALALRILGLKKMDAAGSGTGKRQRTFADIDVDQAGKAHAEAADFVLRLIPRLHAELDSAGVTDLYRDLELPLVPVLLDMEWDGIAIDRDHLGKLSRAWQQRIERIERRIYERAGVEFNLNAPAQIGEVLFDKLEVHRAAGIGRPRRTPTGKYKTDHTILEQLAPHHEVPELILEYRQLSKLKSTWVDALPDLVDPDTGRVHTTFNQAVAATGRLSSDNPNLQNIPIRTEEGREVRRAFVPRAKDWVLLSADYSQIELRILAHMADEPALIDSFRKEEDIHARTAALVHGLLPNMVTPELRNQAKIINYGLIYGMGASRLAQETGLRPPEAKKFIDAYFKALPRVKSYLDDTLHAAREQLFVTTLFGRKRPLPEIQSSNAMQRIAAENMAVNTPIQGTAADIVKRAMLRLHAALAKSKVSARLLLQVHDELVLDVPRDEADVVKGLVRDAMEGAADLRVPLQVSLSTGANWLEAH
ncbi:MAG: DNA polymerase I [Planctomycetota bacterium]